jgi:hypothetical protein
MLDVLVIGASNSAHTRNIRCVHDTPQQVLTEAWAEEAFRQELLKLTGGRTNALSGAQGAGQCLLPQRKGAGRRGAARQPDQTSGLRWPRPLRGVAGCWLQPASRITPPAAR